MLQGANAKDWFEGAVRSAVIEWLDTGKGDDLMNPMTNAELQMAINETFKLIERSDKIQGGENIIDALDKHLLSLLTTQHNRAILITVSLDESPV